MKTKSGSLAGLCIAVLFGLMALPSKVDASCMVCSQRTYAACLNETAFYVCYDGLTVSSTIGSCPDGTVCTGEQGICKPKSTAVAECVSLCGYCVSVFACVSQTKFAYCDANGIKGIIQSCPPDQFCSIDTYVSLGVICAPSCLLQPTCQSTEVITDAPPIADWKRTCDGTTTKAYYKNIEDPTCKTYVYCETLNGIMNAIFYTCSTGYFNEPTQKCIATKPCGCS